MDTHQEDSVPTDLRRQATFAAGWILIGTVGTQAVQFIFSILLARLLLPAEFGLIAMLSLFMALAQSLVDSGFGSALVQKRDATRVDESSVFYLNLIVAVLAYAALWFAAPAIAAFYREPILVPLTRVLAFSFLINSFGLVQIALLQKSLKFKPLTKRMLAGVLVSGPVGVFLAWRGYGVWSLAAQNLISMAVQTALLWFWGGWRPIARFRLDSLREMFGFGSRLLVTGLLNTVFENLYPLVIGRIFMKTELGFFARASTFQKLASTSATGVITQVTFPAFSSIQHDRERLKAGYRKVIKFACFVVFPLMLGLSAIAAPLFLLLFTAEWNPSVPLFQILCIGGMLYPLHALNLNALKAVGRSDYLLNLEFIKKVLTVIALAGTAPFGLTAMVWGITANSFVALYVNTFYTARVLEYPLREQTMDVLPYFALSITMAGLMMAVGALLKPWPAAQLAVQVLVGVAVYTGGAYALRLAALREAKEILAMAMARFQPRETAGV